MKQHLDEREEKAKGQAAWYGFIGFVVLYFITCAVAVSFNQPIDSLMRIIFALSFALFIGIGIKTEAFHFRLPSLKEDDTSLEAPAYIRAVPWLLLVLGGLGFAFNGIIAGIAILIQGNQFLPGDEWQAMPVSLRLLAPFVSSLGLLVIYYLLANLIRHGNRIAIALLQMFSVGVFLAYMVDFIWARQGSLAGVGINFSAGFELVYVEVLAYLAWVSIFRQRELLAVARKKPSSEKSFELLSLVLIALTGCALASFVVMFQPFFAPLYPLAFFWLWVPVSFFWCLAWVVLNLKTTHKKLARFFSALILVGVLLIAGQFALWNPKVSCALQKQPVKPIDLGGDWMDPTHIMVACQDRLQFERWDNQEVVTSERDEVTEYLVGEYDASSATLGNGPSGYRIESSAQVRAIPSGYMLNPDVIDPNNVVYRKKIGEVEHYLVEKLPVNAGDRHVYIYLSERTYDGLGEALHYAQRF